MEFGFTLEEEKFRDEVREWLREKPVDEFSQEIENEPLGSWGASREFSRRLGAKGWVAPEWSKEYGGQERSSLEKLVLSEELTGARAPWGAHFCADLAGPCVLLYGTEEQKREWLPRMARGEVFAEAFSETEAGSDVASIKTQAVEDGGYYIINGQKVWTTYAQLASHCFLAAVTDPNAPPHKGLSLFFVDMKTPGVTIRPITDIDGVESFNEVFFDDVRVPANNLIGEKNKGWRVLMASLNLERCWSRSGMWMYVKRVVEELVEYVKETQWAGGSLADNPLVRQKLAQLVIESEVCRMFQYRVAWMMNNGVIPEHESSITKLFADELGQKLARAGADILGLCGQLRKDSKEAPLRGKIADYYMKSIGLTIAAGTSEIQRNIIASRGLRLPRD